NFWRRLDFEQRRATLLRVNSLLNAFLQQSVLEHLAIGNGNVVVNDAFHWLVMNENVGRRLFDLFRVERFRNLADFGRVGAAAAARAAAAAAGIFLIGFRNFALGRDWGLRLLSFR